MVLQVRSGGGGSAGGGGTVDVAQRVPACDRSTVSAAQHMLTSDCGTVDVAQRVPA